MHWGAYSDNDSVRYTSEDDYGGDQAAAMDGGGGDDNVGRV